MPEPRVLLDATAIPEQRGGVGRYVDGLLTGFDEIDYGESLVVVGQARDAESFRARLPAARILPAPANIEASMMRFAWEQAGLPHLARRLAVNVIHSPHYTHPIATGRPVVVTVHDATFFTHPEAHTLVKRRFFRAWTRRSVLTADGLIAVSASTRNEVLREVGGDPALFTVAHLGVDRADFHVPDPAEVIHLRERLDLGERPWIAFLGATEPRKNVPALVRGYARAFEGEPSPPVLLLAGPSGWDDSVDREIARVPPGLTVRRLGYLPRGDLSAFLGGSMLVAYPSVGEGFGLPVLEAMACGAAVVTTRCLSLPEVGGDAVAYVQPSEDSISEMLAGLAQNPAERLRLQSAGVARARRFTWAECARRHVEAYERATRMR